MSRRKIGNVFSVTYTFIRFAFLRLFLGKRFSAGMIERISPNVVIEFNRGSNVAIGNRVSIHSRCVLKARTNSKLIIGKGVKINYNCMIICRNHVEIGDGTEFGPSVFIFDHDHDFRVGLKKGKMENDSVIIGSNCWIGANTVVLRGTTIGDNSVVAAGCVLKGHYPENSVIVQKKETTVKPIDWKIE